MAETRAILFDLDDTLYPYGAFVKSGFRAVSRRVADEHGLSVCAVLRVLRRAFNSDNRGRELQVLCERLALPAAMIPALVAVLREHRPSLRLPRQSAQVLRDLRSSWRIGVLTNGTPEIQRRKVAALGLTRLVDDVVCATEVSAGLGKPARTTFATALERLGVAASSAVFVGDDPDADIAGAVGAGLRAIHLVDGERRRRRCGDTCPGVHAGQLAHVPALANQLVPARTDSHAL